MTRLIDRIWLNGIANPPLRDYLGQDNLKQTGEMYRDVRAQIDTTLRNEELVESVVSDPILLEAILGDPGEVTAERIRTFAKTADNTANQAPSNTALALNPSWTKPSHLFHWESVLENVTTVVADDVWLCVNDIMGGVDPRHDLGRVYERWDHAFIEFHVGGKFAHFDVKTVGVSLDYRPGDLAAATLRNAGNEQGASALEGAHQVVRCTPFFELPRGKIIGPANETFLSIGTDGELIPGSPQVFQTWLNPSISDDSRNLVNQACLQAFWVALYTTSLAHTYKARIDEVKPPVDKKSHAHLKKTGKPFETYNILRVDSINKAAARVREARQHGDPVGLHHVAGGEWDYTKPGRPGMFGNPNMKIKVIHPPTFAGDPSVGINAKHYDIGVDQGLERKAG